MIEIKAVIDGVEQVGGILFGLPRELQGFILADCLSIWLAGHHVLDETDATRELRARLLSAHLTAVRELTSINAKRIGTPE